MTGRSAEDGERATRVTRSRSNRAPPVPDEQGMVIAWFALAMPLFMIILAYVCDVAWLSYARGIVQAAADAGVLAGVQEIDFERLAEGEVWIDEEPATYASLEYLNTNLVRGLARGQIISLERSLQVYNTGNRDLHGHPQISHPTVCLRVQAGVRLPVTALRYTIEVHSDASIVPRRRS